jgi:bifunctional non-homologous end joining protein LigD
MGSDRRHDRPALGRPVRVRNGRLPATLEPMKAVLSNELPTGDGWAYEIKWDGMRAVSFVEGDTLRLQSTRLADVTVSFPEVEPLAAALGVDTAILDGELVAFDDQGRPSFGQMQQRMHVSRPIDARRRAALVPVTYVVFDLLLLDGHDLTGEPMHERRRVLSDLVPTGPHWRAASYQVDDGEALLAAAAEHGLEGLMAKRLESRYEIGRRSPAWRKVKVWNRQEFVVGGWQAGLGNRSGLLGSLHVGYYDDGALRYAGRVGSGFNHSELKRVGDLVAGLAISECPFSPPPPRTIARDAHWVRPELVAEVSFGSWTNDGMLRHPVYVGLRTDKEPTDVVREG